MFIITIQLNRIKNKMAQGTRGRKPTARKRTTRTTATKKEEVSQSQIEQEETIQAAEPMMVQQETIPMSVSEPKQINKNRMEKKGGGFSLYRNEPDRDTMPVQYRTLNGRGGIVYKVASAPKKLRVYETNGDGVRTLRSLRYCPTEDSIYVDEQSKDSIKAQVFFRDKQIWVNPLTDYNLIKFLDKHPDNVANGGSVFERVDIEKKREVEVDNSVLEAKAVMKVHDTPADELIPVAIALKVDIDKSNTVLKSNLIRLAKRNPKEFLDAFDDSNVYRRAAIYQAFKLNIVEVFRGSVVWASSKKEIVSLPKGYDEKEALYQFCVSSSEGNSVMNQIEKEVKRVTE